MVYFRISLLHWDGWDGYVEIGLPCEVLKVSYRPEVVRGLVLGTIVPLL